MGHIRILKKSFITLNTGHRSLGPDAHAIEVADLLAALTSLFPGRAVTSLVSFETAEHAFAAMRKREPVFANPVLSTGVIILVRVNAGLADHVYLRIRSGDVQLLAAAVRNDDIG